MKSTITFLTLFLCLTFSISTTVSAAECDATPPGFFNGFRFCGSITYDNQTNKKAAGIVYNKYTDSFFTVNSDEAYLYEIEADGTLLGAHKMDGYFDVEGITVINASTLAVVTEYNGGLVVFLSPPSSPFEDVRFSDNKGVIEIDGMASNQGLEGITYDSRSDKLYLARETTPGIGVINNPMSKRGSSSTFEEEWDLAAELAASGHDDVTLINGLSMTANGTMLIVSRSAHCVIEVHIHKGAVIDRFDNIPNRRDNYLQGVTVDAANRLHTLDSYRQEIAVFSSGNCRGCSRDFRGYSYQYFYDFESEMEFCNNGRYDLDWRRQTGTREVILDRIPSPKYFIPTSGSGNSFLMVEFPGGGNLSQERFGIHTPRFKGLKDNFTNPAIKFKYATKDMHLSVQVSNNGFTWKEIGNITRGNDKNLSWKEIVIPIHEYANHRYPPAFRIVARPSRPIGYFPTTVLCALDAFEIIETGGASNRTNEFNLISLDDITGIYPNPASDQLTVDFGDKISLDRVYLQLTNQAGQTIKTVHVDNVVNRVDIDVTDVVPGMYVLTINTDDDSVNKRVVIE